MEKVKIIMELVPDTGLLKKAFQNICGLPGSKEMEVSMETDNKSRLFSISLKAENEVLYHVLDNMYNLKHVDGSSGMVQVRNVILSGYEIGD